MTLEAAIALPVFIMAFLAVAALMQYPLASRRVSTSLSDVARMFAAGGIIAELSGFETLQGDLSRISERGFMPGGRDLEEVLRVLGSLGGSDGTDPSVGSVPSGGSNVSDDAGVYDGTGASDGKTQGGGADIPSSGGVDIQGLIEALRRTGTAVTAKGGKAAQDTVDGILDNLALALVSKRLSDSLKPIGNATDPWMRICVRNGRAGVDLSNSRYYVEDGAVELVAVYTVKPRTLLNLAPAVKCCSRVSVRSWGSGEGPTLHITEVTDGTEEEAQNTADSLWNMGDGATSVWRRGTLIESGELQRLENSLSGVGSRLIRADGMQPGYDALSTAPGPGRATVYQIVSLNPFLPSYQGKPDRIRAKLREWAYAMPSSGSEVAGGKSSSGGAASALIVGTREIILVLPENTPEEVIGDLDGVRTELRGDHVAIQVIRGYGQYDTEETKDGTDLQEPVRTGSDDAGRTD